MHTDEALWHDVHGRAWRRWPWRSSTSSSTPGPQAFQLFDSWAGALSRGRLRALRAAPLAPGVRRARRAPPRTRPAIHFGIGCDHLLESMAAAGPQRDRPRLAHADRRRPHAASAPTSSCRATSTRRSCSPAPTSRSPAPDAVLADNGGHPGHIFNLGHGVHPTSDPGVLAADRRPRPRPRRADAARDRPACVLMAYGTPRHAGRDRAVLHRHPPRPAADAEQLADLDRPLRRRSAGCRPLAERTEAQRDALAGGARRAGARAVRRRARAASTPRRRSRPASTRSPPRASSASSGSCSPRTTRRCRSASTSTGRRRAAAAAASPFAGDRELGHRAGLRRLPRRATCARRLADDAGEHQGRVHRPLAADAHPRHRRPVPRRAAGHGRGRRRRGRPRPLDAVVGRPGSRPAARPSRGSAPTSSTVIDDLAAGRATPTALLVCPCGFVADHLEVLYDLDIEARQRAEAAGLAFARTASSTTTRP